MKKIKLIIAFIAVVLVLIVVLQNTQPVETTFLFYRVTLPNAALIGLALLIGVAAGILAALALSGDKHKKK
jgi:lipopolysaccharide assembly protein A